MNLSGIHLHDMYDLPLTSLLRYATRLSSTSRLQRTQFDLPRTLIQVTCDVNQHVAFLEILQVSF